MTDPHSETIIAAILAQLQEINGGNGYYTTPARVQRYDRTEEERMERPWITLIKVSEGKVLRGNAWDCTLVLAIEGAISDEEDETEDTDFLVACLQDDIERALAAVDWEEIRAKLEQIDASNVIDMDPNDPEDGPRVTVRINYAHDYLSTRTPTAI